MVSLVAFLMGVCLGTIIGIFFLFWLMGDQLRDKFFGINLDTKPIVIDWMDGYHKDIHITMRGVIVFTGNIKQITLDRGPMSGQRVSMEIVSKAEAMREFRY